MTYRDLARDFSPAALRTATYQGEVTRILPRVYVATSLVDDPLVRMRAVSAWVGHIGAVTGVAALVLWGFDARVPRRVTVQLPPRLHREAPEWVRVVRPNVSAQVFRVKDVRVVDVPVAVVQAWNERAGGDGVAVVVEAVKRGATRESIAAVATQTPRVRARAELGALLELLDGGVTSYLEWIARSRVFTRTRFPHLTWQHALRCAGRMRYPDAFDAGAQIALEFDGAGTHSSDADRRRDLERDAELAGIGILTLRFTMEDLLYRPEWCVQRYLEARRARIGR